MIKSEDCVYTGCYCEENVYKFIEKYSDEFDEVYAVFISNPRQQCVIWCQQKSECQEIDLQLLVHVNINQIVNNNLELIYIIFNTTMYHSTK